MKSAKFGLARKVLFGAGYMCAQPGDGLLDPLAIPNSLWEAEKRAARCDYRNARLSGSDCDRPVRDEFPADGSYEWCVAGNWYHIKYLEGPGDCAWMEQCDRNYQARLDREKQAAARKQAHEAQLHEAQEKLKREQPLKEEAEEQLKHAQQLKALEAARSEAARLVAIQPQQSQTPVTKVILSEVSHATLQGDAEPATAGESIPAGYQVHSEAQSVKTDPNYSLHTHQTGSSSAGTDGYSLDSPSGPPPHIPTAMLVAEVLYPFQGASAEELTLSAGERVRVVDQVTPDWWRCEHEGQSGLVPSQYLRTLSPAQVPSALPAGYTGYTTPTSGEALGTAGIFPAATATADSAACNQSGAPEANQDYQICSIQ
jgi:Variant SH3 domain